MFAKARTALKMREGSSSDLGPVTNRLEKMNYSYKSLNLPIEIKPIVTLPLLIIISIFHFFLIFIKLFFFAFIICSYSSMCMHQFRFLVVLIYLSLMHCYINIKIIKMLTADKNVTLTEFNIQSLNLIIKHK